MPFRANFSCLWCGVSHTVRGPDDIEGWAQLCPDCLGRAGDNGFLRFRLRAALEERGRDRAEPSTQAQPTAAPTIPAPRGPTRAPTDDWYLRRGNHARGAVDDAVWAADLDAATLWLDTLPLAGEIVEPVAGEGWWSPLLAGKGELWIHDADAAALDRARERLLAHGLRAHLHPRGPWAEPDREVDALVTTFWLGRLEAADVQAWLALARRWLRPGGRYALLELAPTAAREPSDPRSVDPAELAESMRDAGFGIDDAIVGGAILRVVSRLPGETSPA